MSPHIYAITPLKAVAFPAVVLVSALSVAASTTGAPSIDLNENLDKVSAQEMEAIDREIEKMHARDHSLEELMGDEHDIENAESSSIPGGESSQSTWSLLAAESARTRFPLARRTDYPYAPRAYSAPGGGTPASSPKPSQRVPALPNMSMSTPVETTPSYESERGCDFLEKPGVRVFQRMLNQTYGQVWSNITRTTSYCPGKSGHNQGRAIDWSASVHNGDQKARADALVNWLLMPDSQGVKYANARRLGIQYIIWDSQMFRLYRPSAGWTEYSNCVQERTSRAYDTTCHRDHVHISFNWKGAWGETSGYDAISLPARSCT